jgi:heptosyltransferase-2
LQAGDRYVLWSFFSGAKTRVAPIQNNLGFLLTCKAKVYEDTISYLDYYLKIAESFGAKVISKETEFYLEKNFPGGEKFLLENNISVSDRIIGIHPGASEPTKMWELDNYLRLIDQIEKKMGTKVILFLGPAEKGNLELKTKFGKVIVVDTSVSIQHLAWYLTKCSLLVCNDSGARHLAAALKVPSITLFPEDKISSWKFYSEDQKQFFIPGKRNTNNPAKPFLDSIAVDTVFRKVTEVLGEG